MYRVRLYNVNKFKLLQFMHLSVVKYKSEEQFLHSFKNPPTFLYRYCAAATEVVGYMVGDTVFELFKDASP